MSLVDDILDVLCMVLEYFGVHPDMLVPVWASPLCGPYRSVVRMIGSSLPLAPTPRVHFQIPLITNRPHGYVDTDVPAVPSFADVQWVFDDEGESFARTRNHLSPKKTHDLIRNPRLPPTQAQRGRTSLRQKPNLEALQKISELESELLKLRAQIARIVTVAPCSGLTESQNPPGSPLMFPSSVPARTSTPRSVAPAPPPPPPPPLPPCITTSTETASALELIQQRQIKETDAGLQQTRQSKELNNKRIPSMLDVLKDLNQVKLRSVQTSPGGTPARRRRSRRSAALLNDPAALIAEALKKKFAQHRHNVSSDKENSVELSPFGSPEAPQVSLHNRRSLGRRHF